MQNNRVIIIIIIPIRKGRREDENNTAARKTWINIQCLDIRQYSFFTQTEKKGMKEERSSNNCSIRSISVANCTLDFNFLLWGERNFDSFYI